MDVLRLKFEEHLKEIPGLTIELWKDTELVCLFFHGKEFAHFHGARILDLRLSTKIIRQGQLGREVSAQIHPNRSKNSRWICVELQDESDIEKIIGLVELACGELGR